MEQTIYSVDTLFDQCEGSGQPADLPQCIHERFAEQARLTPDAIALSCLSSQLTYHELDRRAEQLASLLQEAGVGPDALVAIYAERSIEMVVGLLATLKAGGAYLGLDLQAPVSRLHNLLEDARPVLILTQAEMSERLGETHLPHILLTEQRYQEKKETNPCSSSAYPENLAYVSYTSGTTGKPKGVCAPHAAVDRLIHKTRWATFHRNDVFLQLSPIAFDASTLELWAPLTHGGRLAIYPPGPSVPDLVAETLRVEGVTTFWVTTGLFHQMVDSQLDAFASLNYVLTGGEVLSPAHARRLQQAHPHLLFTNAYGPTENTTFTTCWTTSRLVDDGPVPIGSPIDGTQVMILDSDLRAVSPECMGELYITGAGLARGYLNQPGETALRFLPAPGGKRMYQTGDQALWRADGAIAFLGRSDQQIKIRGYRVELGGINAELVRQPIVQDAVTVAQSDGNGSKRLITYVVLTEEGKSDPGKYIRVLHAALLASLPDYMVPWAILPLPAFPLLSNGKVNQAALPFARRKPRSLDTDYVPPRSHLETRLIEIWSTTLGIEPLGIHDDFFDAGGHSLMAAELIRELQRELNVNISARVFYLQPTVAELAATIEDLLAKGEPA